MSSETLLSVLLGLGLSAACGFRVFVPLLVVNLAARAGWLNLADELSWLGGVPALIIFSVATLVEIGAYYIPVLDNLLDTVATPVAVVAGAVVTASVVTGMEPLLKWTLAVIAGGGLAGAVQAATVSGRQLSTLATAGLGNALMATLEVTGSVLLSVLALLAPLLAGVMVLTVLVIVLRKRRRRAARSRDQWHSESVNRRRNP